MISIILHVLLPSVCKKFTKFYRFTIRNINDVDVLDQSEKACHPDFNGKSVP